MSSHLRVLRHPNFRYLFLGQSASAIGDQVVIVALALYITQRTGSATDLGLVLAAQALPLVLLVLFGGVWADRMPRQTIMVGADLVRALLHTLLAALILTGGASVAEMVVIEACFGAARAFFQPAYTGLLPQTTPPELLQEARALTGSTENLSILLGPALGTALVLGLGAGEAFALDAATFAVSAGLLLLVRPSRGRVPAAGTTVWRELVEGYNEVRARPWVWATIAAFSLILFTGYAGWYSLAPVIARDHYGGAGLFGVLESVAGGGALVGSIIGLRWRPAKPLRAGLLLTFFWPAQSIAFALGAPVAVIVVLAILAGWGFALFEIWWQTALATHVPGRALSRVSSYDWMGSLALLPAGFAVAGPLAGAFGARGVLGVDAVISAVMLGLALVPGSTRRLGSAQQVAGDVGEEAAGKAEVADVDSFVGVVDQRSRLQ